MFTRAARADERVTVFFLPDAWADFPFDLVGIATYWYQPTPAGANDRPRDAAAFDFRAILPAVSLSLRFLGTSASRPTVERGVSSIAVVREGETCLFDCGEGTQRQMMRYGVAFSLRDIFFSHMHVDHMLGVVGLMRTMALQGREDALRLWGPTGSSKVLRRAETLGADRVSFPLEYRELSPGESVRRDDYSIVAFAADHMRTPALGFALVEDLRLGRFNPDRARELGVP